MKQKFGEFPIYSVISLLATIFDSFSPEIISILIFVSFDINFNISFPLEAFLIAEVAYAKYSVISFTSIKYLKDLIVLTNLFLLEISI